MKEVAEKLSVIMADTYALYLKTQNYHWHVKGPHFKPLHELFETQYQELALAADEIAERILTLGYRAPATFKEFEKLKHIKDGNSKLEASKMIKELADDRGTLVKDLYKAITLAEKHHDEGTINLLGDHIETHEKARWMLNSSI